MLLGFIVSIPFLPLTSFITDYTRKSIFNIKNLTMTGIDFFDFKRKWHYISCPLPSESVKSLTLQRCALCNSI